MSTAAALRVAAAISSATRRLPTVIQSSTCAPRSEDCRRVAVAFGLARVRLCGSLALAPAITSSPTARSATRAASKPRWMKFANASVTRSCGAVPSVGLSPYTPVHAAGSRVEQPASVASESGARPVAVATPAPAEEPPQVRSGAQGLRVNPVSGDMPSGEWANSVVVVLPIITAPAARRRATAATSVLAGGACAISTEPQRVGRPATSRMSLTETGTPASGPGSLPSPISHASSPARTFAVSSASVAKALKLPCSRCARSSVARMVSRGSRRPLQCSSASAIASGGIVVIAILSACQSISSSSV